MTARRGGAGARRAQGCRARNRARVRCADPGHGRCRGPSLVAILGFMVMAVTQIAYEVEGWGIGELVVAEGRVVWHELPWPRADRTARGVAPAPPLPKAPSQTPTHPGQGAGAR